MKKRKGNPILILISVYFITFLFISIAYSFFNENLELKGKASIATTDKDYKSIVITDNTWNDSSFNHYQFTPTITYLGDKTYTAWQVNIKIPEGTQVTGCYNASECTIVGNILKVKNASWNGMISKNQNTFSFSFQMKTIIPNYNFEIDSVNFINPDEPDVPDPDQPGGNDGENSNDKIDNFKVNILRENYWGNTTQYSISVDNNSDISLSSWTLIINVPPGSKIGNCWGASYILKENTIVLSGPSWSLGLNAKSSITGIGLQLTTSSLAPAKISIKSLSGITNNYENVEMNV